MPWWGERHKAQHGAAGWESCMDECDVRPLDFLLADNLLRKSTWLTLPPILAGRAYLHRASGGQSGRTEPGFPLEGHELCVEEGTGRGQVNVSVILQTLERCVLSAGGLPSVGSCAGPGAWQETERKGRLQTEDTDTISPEPAAGGGHGYSWSTASAFCLLNAGAGISGSVWESPGLEGRDQGQRVVAESQRLEGRRGVLGPGGRFLEPLSRAVA